MAHFCWFLKYIFLLLMLSRAPTIDTRPARQSDLIAGNEFLKLFLNHDEQQRNLHSMEYQGQAESHDVDTSAVAGLKVNVNRATNARSLEHKTRYRNLNSHEDDSKQVVKLVTTGSKIVFLEEYDDDEAVANAVAREIGVRSKAKATSHVYPQHHQSQSKSQASVSDEVKVLAVSVSTSSKRGEYRTILTTTARPIVSTLSRTTSTTASPTKVTALAAARKGSATAPDYINRSHKSELSIEEVEPLTMLQYNTKHTMDAMDENDSVNSASTHIQNVLAAPLVSAASTRSAVYHSSGQNATAAQLINQSAVGSAHEAIVIPDTSTPTPVEDKLLPFQTVIYHDSKHGHGPQSRSISYSSISQHVEDLQTWQQTGGILAEAQRNVSESLKPMPPRPQSSEPSKFYSVPAKMYSVPAKFYSEPAKVYSEPAKVYGQAEKVYSEPAKVYGQPSKYYSEPAKVYSQPAKVYGEPAKTYWPHSLTTSTTTTTSTMAPPTFQPTMTSTAMPVVTVASGITPTTYLPSRRPAIVSRIAFGEAHQRQQQTTTTTTTTKPRTTTTKTTTTSTTARPIATWQQHHHYHNQQPQHQQHNIANSQARRVLFNLDKLPYDLLNAPEQSSRHLLEPIISKSPTAAISGAATATETDSPNERHHHHQHHNNHQQQLQPHHPCWEPATSSLSTSQHQQRQHSSLSVQHSNQNAKGLPNRDLVKCVSKYAPATGAAATTYSSSSSSTSYGTTGISRATQQQQHQRHHQPTYYTTERNNDELYTPTPEQNYEIEESVSVMTNGRAHGVLGIGPALSASTTPTTPATARHQVPTSTLQRNRNHFAGAGSGGGGGSYNRGRGSIVYNSNANANADYDGNGDGDDVGNNDGDGDGDVDVDDNGNIAGSNGGGTGNADGGDGDDEAKVAYVVEGRNYRKYRVEEKTDDGFIVGEYGVVDHNDGNLRGVRYTADSTINRSLIQKALLTFLKLK